jgi:hypothetical protein
LNGQYYLVEFCDWNMLGDSSLFSVNNAMQGKPKTIAIIKDGEVHQYSFENVIGVQLGITMVTSAERQRIVNIYQRWRRQ